MRPTVCKHCPAPLPTPTRVKRGAPRTVCEDCTRALKKDSNHRSNTRRSARRAGRILPRGSASKAYGPAEPLDAERERRELAAREARFVRAVREEGLSMDALLERFPDAKFMLFRLGLRLQPKSGYPLGIPA